MLCVRAALSPAGQRRLPRDRAGAWTQCARAGRGRVPWGRGGGPRFANGPRQRPARRSKKNAKKKNTGRQYKTTHPSPPSPPPTQWLTYWVVYALYGLVEAALVLTKWVPLYYELKLAALVWLVAPQTKGAELVYERVVAPALKTHASRLDPVFSGAERVLKAKQIGQVADLAKKYGPETAAKVIAEAAARAGELAAATKPPVAAS